MKAAPFRYHAPRSRAELFALLKTQGNARLLAGGQSLVPLMNLRLAAPDHLIDLARVPGLDGLAVADGMLQLGAMLRQRMAEQSALVARYCPLLAAALGHVGSQQIRNRGTLGGSLAHADPTAELSVVASVQEARLRVESAGGARILPFSALSAGYLATTLATNEVLTRIDLPIWPAGHGWGFAEITRRGEGFAMVMAAVLLALDPAGRVQSCAMALGGLAAAPIRVAAAEARLLGRVADDPAIAEAAAMAGALPAEGDLYAPADYKQHLARVLAGRCLAQAVARARIDDRTS